MKLHLKYIFETKDGFRYERETPEEILAIVEANMQVLKKLAKDTGGDCNASYNLSNPYMPTGSISCTIRGTHRYYTLRTEVTQI